jgi:hypothetical protein
MKIFAVKIRVQKKDCAEWNHWTELVPVAYYQTREGAEKSVCLTLINKNMIRNEFRFTIGTDYETEMQPLYEVREEDLNE